MRFLETNRPRLFLVLPLLLLIGISVHGLSSTPPATAQVSGTVPVTISGYAYNPSTITVVIGVNNTVTWTNDQSGVPYHTVTADDGSFGSGHLGYGATYTHTFDTPGTFGYHCTLHPYMKGTVVVESGSSGPTTSTSTISTAPATTTQATSASVSTSSSLLESTTTSTAAYTSSSGTSTTSHAPSASQGGNTISPYVEAGVVGVIVLVAAALLLARRRKTPRQQTV